MSKVSIIVPIYNGENVIERCVDSILAQDYKDIEVLLIDDGSKDNSFKVIEECAKKDERIVAIHKENGGVSSTRNLALSKATGDYIQFIDVDDWLPFDSTKLMVRAIEDNKADMVIADFYRVVEDKTSKKGSIKDGGLLSIKEYADKMLLTPADFYYGALWNKLYKKEIIDKYNIRMDVNVSYSEDNIFNLEYLKHIDNIYVLKSPVYYYVKTEGSLVSKNLNIQNTVRMKTTVIKYYDDFYKVIFGEEEYEFRRPVIYTYLVSISTDAFTVPFIDNVKKLGEENVGKVYYDESLLDTSLYFNYLQNKLFEQLLNAIASQNKLDINDIKILYFMYKKNGQISLEEMSSVCNISNTSCAINVAKLLAGSYIKVSDIRIFDEEKIMYEYVHTSIDEQFKKIDDDFYKICFDGLDEDSVKNYFNSKKVMLENLQKVMKTQ